MVKSFISSRSTPEGTNRGGEVSKLAEVGVTEYQVREARVFRAHHSIKW
jgi:hypothetical protein